MSDKYQTPETATPDIGAVIWLLPARFGVTKDLQLDITPALTGSGPTVTVWMTDLNKVPAPKFGVALGS